MPRAAILTFDDCYASSVGGFADILQIANSHLQRQDGPKASLFEWQFISAAGGPVMASNGLSLQTQPIKPRQRFDVIFVPSIHYRGHREFEQLLQAQAEACAWIVAQWRAGSWVAANCTGTFLLAHTGLLDDRVATTTWWLERQFRLRFPKVDLQLRPVLTEVDRLICAGASASYLLQAIRVVERFCGPALASRCAKSMLIDVSQTSQIPHIPLLLQQDHSDSVVHRAQQWLQGNMDREFRMSDLADTLGISDRTLIRRFRSALDQTPLNYLQDLRLESARALLETSALSVEDIVAQVGYGDTSSFSRLFRQRIGMSPGAYRGRFQPEGAA